MLKIFGALSNINGILQQSPAKTAINHYLYLVTRNVRDTHPSGATIFDPWNDEAEKFPLSPHWRGTR